MDYAFPRVVDATMLSDWRSCPHRFFRRHIQGLTRARTNVHLHFGGALARGLEVARRGYCAHGDTKDALTDGCEALIERWGDFAAPETPSRSEANKTLDACLLALQGYLREWPLDTDYHIHHHSGLPGIEFSGAWPLPRTEHPVTGEPILYTGRFDEIVDFRSSVWGLDDKTTSMNPNNEGWRNQWKLRSQFTGYTWIAAQYGIPLSGFLIRGIGVLARDIHFAEVIVPRPGWQVDAWLAQTIADVRAMVEQWKLWVPSPAGPRTWCIAAMEEPHPFSQRFDHACADFGGCTYLDLCGSSDPDAWLGEYIVDYWNPLARDES